MKVYGLSGAVDGFRADADEEAQFPIPAGATVVEFDPTTNAALAADLARSTDAYTLPGGVLTTGGQAVTIVAPGTAYSEATDIRATGQQALDSLTTYLGISSPTAAQTTAAVKLLCRVARFLLRRELARLG